MAGKVSSKMGGKEESLGDDPKKTELGGNLWEFSSDVLNFPREVGGEVIFESEGAGEEIDLVENEGSGEGCGGEFRDREYSAGDEKGCSQALSPATKVHFLCLPCPNPLWL